MTEQKEIMLNGFIGSNPLGALAAFGLLRVCSEIPELSQSRLCWRMEDDWVAVLMASSEIDVKRLIELLVERQKRRSLDVFDWSEDIRVVPQDYRVRLTQHAETATYHDRWRADYYAAFGSEVVTDGAKGLVKPTAFHMTSGQQKFLKGVREIGESLTGGDAEALREALFGPWRYEDQYHALGLDPMTERMYALRHRAPTSESPRSVRAAVWFAIESLPLFPTSVSGRRLKTTAFNRGGGNVRLTWPIWAHPIGLYALRSLLATSELIDGPEAWRSLGRRGVTALYQSVRSEFGQGYAILRPATLVWSAE